MEFETGGQVMTPEMYEAYGFPSDSLPSHLHMSRAADVGGKPIGFYGDPKFSRGCVAICDIGADGVTVELVPLDLDLNRPRRAERGFPAMPTPDTARQIAAEMARMSEYYGTQVTFDEASGLISVKAPG